MNDSRINEIICGDCMETMRELKCKSVDLIVTDIPYGKVTKNGAERERYKGQLRNINKGDADVITFDTLNFIEECERITKGSIYIFCGIEQVSQIYAFFDNHNDFMARQ